MARFLPLQNYFWKITLIYSNICSTVHFPIVQETNKKLVSWITKLCFVYLFPWQQMFLKRCLCTYPSYQLSLSLTLINSLSIFCVRMSSEWTLSSIKACSQHHLTFSPSFTLIAETMKLFLAIFFQKQGSFSILSFNPNNLRKHKWHFKKSLQYLFAKLNSYRLWQLCLECVLDNASITESSSWLMFQNTCCTRWTICIEDAFVLRITAP